MNKNKDWLKLKKYLHFSPQYEFKHIPFLRSYVSNSDNVIKHCFYPFIHYTVVENKFRRLVNLDTGERNENREIKVKKRQIFYADHLDNLIFSYYSKIINDKLECIYHADSMLSNSVIAYRAIRYDDNRNKCNIDFANEVFSHIKQSNDTNLVVLCFDVKSFFDTLDHKILKKAWCKLLGQNNLPLDHYKVFNAITKFTYVEIGDLIKEFDELNIKKIIYLKNKNIRSFCKNGNEFRKRVKDKQLINYNKFDFTNNKLRVYGIPQGSSISATLSNLYLLEFDKMMTKQALELGGLYRRYSDDILFICSIPEIEQIKNIVYQYMNDADRLNLVVQEEKTQEVIFHRASIEDEWSCYTDENGRHKKVPLSYLGFDFDGKSVRVRNKSLSLYYRNLKRIIRRKARYAFYATIHNLKYPYREKIYKRKSHLGAKRKKIDGKTFWGNYISYIKTASNIMQEPALKQQIRNHWRIITARIIKLERYYKLPKTPSKKGKPS
jgi:hypothetical protein